MDSSSSPRRRRRANTNELVTIYWRDIPAQVTATVDGAKGSWLLEARFQRAVDSAATVAGLTGADDYVRQWRRDTQPCCTDPELAARAHADSLQRSYNAGRLRSLIASGGLDATTTNATPLPTQTS